MAKNFVACRLLIILCVHVRHHGGRTELGELTTNSNIPVYNSSFNS